MVSKQTTLALSTQFAPRRYLASGRAATVSDQKVKRAPPDSFFSSPSTEPDLLKTSTVSFFFFGTGVGISWISRDRADESNYESKVPLNKILKVSRLVLPKGGGARSPSQSDINGETGAKERSEAELARQTNAAYPTQPKSEGPEENYLFSYDWHYQVLPQQFCRSSDILHFFVLQLKLIQWNQEIHRKALKRSDKAAHIVLVFLSPFFNHRTRDFRLIRDSSASSIALSSYSFRV